jgi:hypothetical protein
MACVPKMANVGQISMAREKIVLGIYKIWVLRIYKMK